MDLLRHLRYFVAVAEELHFGRAADRLQMSQSPLSQRIRSLEAHFGVELLVRTTRRVELTPAGVTLLAEAEAVLERVEALQSTMAGARSGDHAVLRAGVSADLPPRVLADVIDALGRTHPAVQVVPVEQTQPDQRKALVDGRIDVGFLRWPVPSTIRHGDALVQSLGALVPDADPFAAGDEVDLSLLGRGRTLVLPPRDEAPEHHDAIMRGCHARGFVPGETLSASSGEFATSLVLATGAIALVHEPATVAEGTTWLPIAGQPFRVTASVAWRLGERRDVVCLVAELMRDALLASGRWQAAARPPSPPPAQSPSAPRPADTFLG